MGTNPCCSLKIKENNNPRTSVIVIGGGIAGTTAASFLAQSGFSVIIAEANDYIGGRLKTQKVELPNKKIFNFDLGASWIHGFSMENPLRTLSRRVDGFQMIETEDNSTIVFDERGKNVDNECDKFEERFYALIEKQAYEFERTISMKEAIQKIDHILLKNPYFMYHIGTNLEFETSGTFDKLSAVWDDSKPDGKEQLVVSGYQKFAQIQAAQQNIKVLLNHQAIKIEYQEGLNVVTFSNGTTLEAKYVVVSVPLGILKAHRIKFKPNFPETKQEAINSIGFGNVCKILIVFQHIDFLKISQHFIGVVDSNIHHRGLATYFVNLYSLANVPALMTFGLGPNADEVQNMPENELKKILSKRVSVFAKRNINPQQFTIYRSSWRHSQHILGAYSYGSTKTNQQSWNSLAQPVLENRWYFCGEHTYPKYRGTVHGAYLSGKQTAKAIIQSEK